jgi:hypothetical protein
MNNDDIDSLLKRSEKSENFDFSEYFSNFTFMEKYKSEYAIRISKKNFGFENKKNKIKSVPLYAVFCI